MKTPKHIGEAFRFVRLAMNMTQADVAVKAGLSEQYIGNLENDKRDPTWSTVRKVCNALGVNITFIIALTEADQPKVRSIMPLVYNEMWSVTRELERV